MPTIATPAHSFGYLTALIASAASWRDRTPALSAGTMLDAALMRDAMPTPRERVTARREVYAMRVHGTTWSALAARPELPYAAGCRHASPCANVYAGRACALDASKRNGYSADGRATVAYLTDDDATGTAAGSVVYALDPYTGKPSGQR